MRRVYSLGIAVWLVVLSSCSPAPVAKPAAGVASEENVSSPPLTKVKLLLNWFPEAEHGGFYTAQLEGYYKAAGLEVEIVAGGPNSPVVQQVASQKMEFGIANADDVVFGRAQEAPVVAVFAALQTSPRCIMVHEGANLNSLADLKDMTLAMSSKGAFSHFLRDKYKWGDDVQIVPYPGNVTQFLQDKNFAQQAYVNSEPIVAKKMGGDPKVLLVADVGYNPYSSCLITTDQLAQEKAELVQGFVAASLQGWQKYLADPTRTNAEINRLNSDMSLDVLEQGMPEVEKLAFAEGKPEDLGQMSEERWQSLVQQLTDLALIKSGQVKVDELFTNKFIPVAKPE